MQYLKAVRAHVILEAARLAANADIRALEQLLVPGPLKHEHVLRILLTFLPAGVEPESYIDLIQNVAQNPSKLCTSFSKRTSYDISDQEACSRVRQMQLLPLNPPHYFLPDADSLTLFLIHRSYLIDRDSGSLDVIARLLDPFVDHSEILRTWMISTLLPLTRLGYEYYPRSSPSISLESFEMLGDNAAIHTLLSHVFRDGQRLDEAEVGRDLRGLVGPWMYGESFRKRRKLQHVEREHLDVSVLNKEEVVGDSSKDSDYGWSIINDRLRHLGTTSYESGYKVFMQWDGPKDVDMGDWGKGILSAENDGQPTKDYAQMGLALAYSAEPSSENALFESHQVLTKVSRLLGFPEPPDATQVNLPIRSGLTPGFLARFLSHELLTQALLQTQNSFTSPVLETIVLQNLLLSSCYKLSKLGNPKSVSEAARLCMFGGWEDQSIELRKTLQGVKTDRTNENWWFTVRDYVLWLQNWEVPSVDGTGERFGVYSKVSRTDVEKNVLKAMIEDGGFTPAIELYGKTAGSLLPPDIVEETVMGTAYSAYDSASNGNKSRGGVRRALQTVSAFSTVFPESFRFGEMRALISATHSMSFYSLSLQHGVPFQPVNIRAHKDPIALIGKILDQNSRSYTHLDDLLQIGENLVIAGIGILTSISPEISARENQSNLILDGRRRITRMAIEAALAEDDFETAYSYVVNRLVVTEQLVTNAPATDRDDISWRAAYAAGRYPTSNSGKPASRRLEQRMELLSQALILAPPPSLTEILSVWQQCDKQMADLVEQEMAEESKWDDEGDQNIPGGFANAPTSGTKRAGVPARGTLLEEAPMGLFEVARGAASALSKNAFPLRAAQKSTSPSASKFNPQDVEREEGDSSLADGQSLEGAGRVRKRDMVSNMVTGGLVSGIGWVIGKPPVKFSSFWS